MEEMSGALSASGVAVGSSGVRSSGRVRKKSSKLADFFESPDEMDRRNPSSKIRAGLMSEEEAMANLSEEEFARIPNVMDMDLGDLNDMLDMAGVASDANWEGIAAVDDGLAMEGSVGEGDQLIIDDSKKPTLAKKGGKRKSGGSKRSSAELSGLQPRYPAYVLFVKAMLDKEGGAQGPEALSEASRRLAGRWRALSRAEKELWRRKAIKLDLQSSSGTNESGQLETKRARTSQVTSSSSLAAPLSSPPISPSYSGSGLFKVTGTDPLDAAAHLKLLGESLTVIGERLTEHDGQIAVSGSLSVLLDSLLCALGPLMCLTKQVPELNNAVPHSTLTATLDNIAYIMPGL